MGAGVEVRHGKGGGSIRIRFVFRGVECRETIKLPPTRANLAYAERLRGEILNAIGRGQFRYGDYFPASKMAARFGQAGPSRETMGTRLDKFLQQCAQAVEVGRMSPSTLNGYRKAVDGRLRPEFGQMALADIGPPAIKSWLSGLGVTAKTARNLLSLLSMVLADALTDGAILENPLAKLDASRVIDKTARQSAREVDPFTAEEVRAIVAAAGKLAPLVRFAVATGLRTSELIALEWTDIDKAAKVVRVTRGQVVGVVKGPKTRAGIRAVDLTPEALAALDAAGTIGGRVFRHPLTGKPLGSDKDIYNRWADILTAAGVRYRKPYNTRHTFASTLLSAGANPWWVAQQMGHETVEMVFRHYGKWIPETAQNPPKPAPVRRVS